MLRAEAVFVPLAIFVCACARPDASPTTPADGAALTSASPASSTPMTQAAPTAPSVATAASAPGAMGGQGTPPVVGGGCKYDDIPGTCTAKDDGKFTFDGTLDGKPVSLADNTMNDRSGALSKPGASTPCTLKLETHGTCTPCVLSVGACGKPAWDAMRARAH